MKIRKATESDVEQLKLLYIDAFSAGEGRLVGKLARDLVLEKTEPETLSYVVETEGLVVGHIGFSPVYLRAASSLSAYILSPLAVRSDHQRQGIGSKLIAHGKETLTNLGANFLLVYGDPDFYRRFGFDAEQGKKFVPRFPLEYEFGWQALALTAVELESHVYPVLCVNALNKADYW